MNPENSSNQIKLGAMISYIAIGINILTGIIYTPWMLEQIGKSHYGLYTLAISIISLITMDFGLSSAVSRFTSKYIAQNDRSSIANILGTSFKLYMIISALISLVLFVLYFFLDVIYMNFSPEELSAFKVIYVLTSVFTVICFPFTPLNGILISYERFVALKLTDLCNKLLTVIVTVFALIFGFGLYALVAINAVFNLVTVIVKLLIVKTKTPAKINFKHWKKETLAEILSFSVWITLISIFQRLIFNITPTILGVVSNTVSIAIFGLAATLEGYVFTFANAINGLFLTKVSRILTGKTAAQDLLMLMNRVGRLNFSVLWLIFIGFLLLGREFIALWVGPDYQEVYFCVLFLILPGVLYFPQQIANTAIVASNKVKQQSIVYMLVGLINIVLSPFLSTRFGAVGACLSIGIANLSRIVMMNILYFRALHINLKAFYHNCFIRLGGIGLLSAIAGLIFCTVFTASGWPGFLLRGSGVVSIYVAAMWLWGWNRYEKDLCFSAVKKALRLAKH